MAENKENDNLINTNLESIKNTENEENNAKEEEIINNLNIHNIIKNKPRCSSIRSIESYENSTEKEIIIIKNNEQKNECFYDTRSEWKYDVSN